MYEPTVMNQSSKIIHEHHVRIGQKGGRRAKGSPRRLWTCRLAAAIRWGNQEKADEARAAITALSVQP